MKKFEIGVPVEVGRQRALAERHTILRNYVAGLSHDDTAAAETVAQDLTFSGQPLATTEPGTIRSSHSL